MQNSLASSYWGHVARSHALLVRSKCQCQVHETISRPTAPCFDIVGCRVASDGALFVVGTELTELYWCTTGAVSEVSCKRLRMAYPWLHNMKATTTTTTRQQSSQKCGCLAFAIATTCTNTNCPLSCIAHGIFTRTVIGTWKRVIDSNFTRHA